MKAPVFAYMGVISAMLVAAAGAAPSDPRIFIGAALFYVSNLFVARERFVASGYVNGAIGLRIAGASLGEGRRMTLAALALALLALLCAGCTIPPALEGVAPRPGQLARVGPVDVVVGLPPVPSAFEQPSNGACVPPP